MAIRWSPFPYTIDLVGFVWVIFGVSGRPGEVYVARYDLFRNRFHTNQDIIIDLKSL